MIIADRLRMRLTQFAAVTAFLAAMTGVLTEAAAQGREQGALLAGKVATAVTTSLSAGPPRPLVLRWSGKDVDGDGADDFVNPTGKPTRTEDAYGYGYYGASRDGGAREHKGVDFTADAGQPVKAPISGYVTKIGFAYAGDDNLKFVEIRNPALHYEARVFYVNPDVAVGDAVHIGRPIGTMHTLQDKYPAGMTDHVHLELTGPDGQKFDATEVLTAHVVRGKRALG